MRRFRKRFSSGRRRFKRRFIGKRQRSARIYRRFIRRKAKKPELKYKSIVAAAGLATGGASATRITFAASTDNIANGTGVDQKIGRQVNLTKVNIRMRIANNSANGSLTAPSEANGIYRVIFWTPRVDFTAATNYMNTLTTPIDQINFDIVTVHYDRCMSNSNPIMAAVAGSVYGPSGGPSLGERVILKTFKFPRKCKFYEASPATLNVDKDILYCTIIGGRLSILIDCVSRTWYYDS